MAAAMAAGAQLDAGPAQLQQQLDFMRHHDALTLLPNRLLLRRCFEQAASGWLRAAGMLALLAIDLDDFRQVRNNIGQERGDQMLLQAVLRMQHCLRPDDVLAHHGGGEFTLLLRGVSPGAAQQVAEALRSVFVEPFESDGCVLTLSLSIGIGLYPADGASYDEVQQGAGIALAHACDGGHSGYLFCTAQMRAETVQRMHLHGQLRNAVRQHELLLHYQPQIAIGSGRVVGMEALVRWRRANGVLEYPGRFIPLAERSGLIVAIGEWVLNEACRQARAWQLHGYPALMVAVNLSALQFRNGNIVATVADALERSGLAPAQLELELTESILLQDSDSVNKSLLALKAMGVALSIDDFGTGYSNLSYLKSLAVDRLKIDQSFVRGLGEDAGNSAIVKAIIQLGHTLQLSVIAEGVESDRQLAVLSNYGCDQAQGYLFGKPVPAEQFAALFEQSDLCHSR